MTDVWSLDAILANNPEIRVMGGTGNASRNAQNAMPVARQGSKTTPSPKPSKYHNEKVIYNGVKYDSKKEAQKAQDLDLEVKAGEIDFYLRQVPFPLPGGIVYRADFVTFEKIEMEPYPKSPTYLKSWLITVIEAKGFWTPEAKLKMKLFKEAYPNLEVQIV